jgi:hypothetical protein
MDTSCRTPQDSSALKQAEFNRNRQQYWDHAAKELDNDQAIRNYYRRRLAELCIFLIPPGMRVLEIGCGEVNARNK